MKSADLLKEIKKLSLAEKLLLVEDVWDSIAQENEVPPLHEWQKRELDRRLSEYQKGGVEVIEASKVYEDLRNRYK
ncbi:MAG TPA: addiction module protein [Candidatus Rifleibacterium sp.]|nr:addiction module protein [Candidatus Rifleibacterium sp.]